MNFTIFVVASLALFAVLTVSEAAPQRVRIQKLPYYPPRAPRPRPMRVRRQVFGGQLTSNPLGGSDAQLSLSKGIGTPNHNLMGSLFAAGNTQRGPVTTGGTLAYNNNGFGAALTKEHVPGMRDTFTKSVSANLFNNGIHNVDANAFKSHNTLANGLKFDRNGIGLGYSHINGHSLGLSQSHIPNFGKQLEVAGKANLWSSADRNTRLDLTGGASKWTSGPLSGKTNFNTGVGLTHLFG